MSTEKCINRNALYDSFRKDCGYDVSNETVDKLLDAAETLIVKKKTLLVEEGRISTDFFITVKGMTRIAYYDGTKEVTFGFGGEGSVFMSPNGFRHRHPAFLSLIAQTDCEMLVVRRAALDALLDNHPDVLRMLFNITLAQFEGIEFKLSEGHKTAKERYRNLINRTDLVAYEKHNIRYVDFMSENVSDRVLASYLNVIPTHLSSIKREIIAEDKSTD